MRAVFGADEQSEVEVDVLRWVRLARMVLDQERVPEESEMSVIFVDEQAMSDLHERFLGGSGPTDVLAFPMDDDVAPGGRQPDQGGRGPGSPAEAADPPTVHSTTPPPTMKGPSTKRRAASPAKPRGFRGISSNIRPTPTFSGCNALLPRRPVGVNPRTGQPFWRAQYGPTSLCPTQGGAKPLL